MPQYSISHLSQLEAESIHVMREVVAEFERPVMLYSVGKDSSVMLHLARKAFYPQKLPFPLMHVDTGYKFEEMYDFRARMAEEYEADLIVYRNEDAISDNANPYDLGTQRCCGLLKTQALLDGLKAGRFDAALGGARREEEKSRAKERFFSFRDRFGQWDPKNQRPELWNLYNCRVGQEESIRVFPLSNWTELDIWMYIHREHIPVVPLYFARERRVVIRGEQLIPVEGQARDAARRDPPLHGLPVPHPGLFSVHRRRKIHRHFRRGDHRGNDGGAHIRAVHAHHRSRPGRLDGVEEAGRLFLMPIRPPKRLFGHVRPFDRQRTLK